MRAGRLPGGEGTARLGCVRKSPSLRTRPIWLAQATLLEGQGSGQLGVSVEMVMLSRVLEKAVERE